MILQKPSNNKSTFIHSHSPSSSYLQTQSQSPHPHTQNHIELQISISIGKTKYLLQVQKCENLHEEVQRFLKGNNLNCKYEGMILQMVRQQLWKREGRVEGKEKEKSKILVKAVQELKKVKDQMEGKRKIEERVKKNERCLKQQTSVEMDLSNKQNKSVNIQSKQNSQTTHQNSCKNVYQKWKIKQKHKQRQLAKTPKHSKNVSNISKLTIINQKQKSQKTTDKNKDHSSQKLDHFYTKGIKFNYAKQQNRQNLFKQQYPFQPQNNREVSLTPRKKNQLHERLYKESKVKQLIKIQKRISEEQNNNRSISKYCNMDKYKKRVIERDGKVNEALNYLIDNKMIENPYRIQSVGKSPFRRTNCY